jgi:site-specific DNA-cytosine methylase
MTRENARFAIWASPECKEYSIAKTHGQRDLAYADKLVKQTIKIIRYFQPRVWFIENPQTGLLKTRPFMKDAPFYDVTYCKYGYLYMKPTRIWTNLQGFKPKYCKYDCSAIKKGKHTKRLGTWTSDDPSREESSLRQKYSIPVQLIRGLFRAYCAQMRREYHA